MRRDAIFYQIFKRFPNVFFALIGVSPDQTSGYRFESVEVKEPSFRIDGVFLPPQGIKPRLVYFAEFQFQKDQSLYHRFFAELFLYLYRSQTQYDDWQGVLIFPSRRLEPDDNTIYRALLNSTQVQSIYLDELGNSEQQPIAISLVQLMVADDAETIGQAQLLIGRSQQEPIAELPPQAIIDIVTIILIYKFSNLTREEVDMIVGHTLEETRVYRDAKAEGLAEGRAEGLAEGRAEGERQGKLAAVPLLIQAGFTVEQIAEQLQLDVESVRQTAQV